MLTPFRSLLAFAGRHATWAYAISVILGLALPQIAAALRPFIPISIFVFIVLAFARANLPGLRMVAGQPVRLVFALAISTAIPPLVGWLLLASPLTQGLDPGTRLAISLMAAAPPLMAAPVYVAILGLENSFALTMLVLGMVLAPLTAPMLATLLAGAEVPLTPLALAERLAIFIGLGMLAGLAMRRLLGTPRILALKNELDGVGVLMFFLFAIAAMDGVIDAALARPAFVLTLLGLSILFSAVAFLLAYLCLRSFGFNDRFSISIAIGLRNMGLLMAPILWMVPPSTFLYFSLAQVPIYFAPLVLQALKERLDKPRTTAT